MEAEAMIMPVLKTLDLMILKKKKEYKENSIMVLILLTKKLWSRKWLLVKTKKLTSKP